MVRTGRREDIFIHTHKPGRELEMAQGNKHSKSPPNGILPPTRLPIKSFIAPLKQYNHLGALSVQIPELRGYFSFKSPQMGFSSRWIQRLLYPQLSPTLPMETENVRMLLEQLDEQKHAWSVSQLTSVREVEPISSIRKFHTEVNQDIHKRTGLVKINTWYNPEQD